ncbi:MAG: beta-galactosidase, partial [Promethearchaeota archaeon]
IKDLGFKHVATYIEWNFHRITPNGTPIDQIKYDFTGETDQQRDLAGYLDMIDDDDTLWLTVRPGPYIYAETEFGGPPEEASNKYYHRLHPKFLEFARHYLKAVCRVLRPHLATNGGKIVLCQLDNEVSMIMKKNQIIDGPVDVLGSFANFLNEKYGDLNSVNKTYGTSWPNWEDMEPTILPSNKKEFIAFLDSAEYIEWYCQKYFEIIAKFYREGGIDVPFYVNSTGGPFPHDPEKLGNIICMTDLYYLDELPNMLPFNAKLLKSTQPITGSAEFRCGTFGHALSNKNYIYQAALWMAYGFHGVNYFMLVDRHRWANCPIDAVGRPGTPQIYSIFKKICKTYNELDYPRFANGLVSNINLLWWRKHAFVSKPDPTEPYSSGRLLRTNTNFNLMYRSLLYGNIQFDIYYPDAKFNKSRDMLIYAGHDFYDETLANKLLDHALDGGTLVFYYNYPVKNIDGSPIHTFDDYLVQPKATHRLGDVALIQFGEADRESMPPMISVPTECLMDYDISKIPQDDVIPFHFMHMNAGYVVKAGKGQIVMLGFDVTQDSIKEIFKLLGFKPAIYTSTKNVMCTILKDGPEYVIGIINNSNSELKDLKLFLEPSKIDCQNLKEIKSLLQGKNANLTGNTIKCSIPANEGDIIWLK